MRIAVIGAGVAGAYLMNRVPPEHEVEAFEMRTEKNWYTVCAWGTSEPIIRDMVKKAGFNFDDYVLHTGKRMIVDLGDEELEIKLKGLVTYDKHRLTHDMIEGKKVHWGEQVKEPNGRLEDFDMVVDATGLHRSLLPKVGEDLLIPSLEYQVKSKDLPYDDFVIRPNPGLCVTGETLVMANPGARAIAEVKIGERVLTKEGWAKVEEVYARPYSGTLVKITPFLCSFPVGLTAGHLVWVLDRETRRTGWKPAESVREVHKDSLGDYVGMPIPNHAPVQEIRLSDYVDAVVNDGKIRPKGRNQFGYVFGYRQGISNDLAITEEFGEFIGYYISEGSAFHAGIILTNYDKSIYQRMKRLGELLFGIEGKEYYPNQVQFNSTILKKFFVSLFGEGAHFKRIPPIALGFPHKAKIALLKGLFIGDGSKEKPRGDVRYDHFSYTTRSRDLAFGLWQLLLNVGIVGSVAYSNSSKSYRIRVHGTQLRKLGNVFGRLALTSSHHPPRKYFVRDNMLYFAVRKVVKKEVKGIRVHDLRTNGSYATSFLVHNSGYWWYFPLGDGMAHVGAGDLRGAYRGELDEFVKKYNCEVLRKIGRPVRVTPPKLMEPFFNGKVVGVGESIGTVYPMLGEGIIPSMQCVDLFMEHLGDREGYRKAVLDHFAVYAKVFEFIKAKIDGRFSLARMWPTLLTIFLYMKRNETRYGLEVKLSDFYKIATRL